MVAIINLQQDMFCQLHQYRNRKVKEDKRHLFAAHSLETEIVKRTNLLVDQVEQATNKTNAA